MQLAKFRSCLVGERKAKRSFLHIHFFFNFKVDSLLSKFDSIWKLSTLEFDLQPDAAMSELDPLAADTLTWSSEDLNLGMSSDDELSFRSSRSREEPGGFKASRKRKRPNVEIGKRRKTLNDDSSNPFDGSCKSLINFDPLAEALTDPLEVEPGQMYLSNSFDDRDQTPAEFCQICGAMFSTSLELAKHTKSRHERGGSKAVAGLNEESFDWICHLCSDRFAHAAHLKSHFLDEHQIGQKKEPTRRRSTKVTMIIWPLVPSLVFAHIK